jgi:hypothetical protein
MHIAVNARRVLARHPWIYWAACLVVAGLAAMLAGRYVSALDTARHGWGTTGRVVVADVEHLPGEPLRAETVTMPLAVIPPGAVESFEAGTVVRQRITAGEIVVHADLAAPSGPAALAETGTLVVGITDPLAAGARVGLAVQIASEGIVLADEGRVVGLADGVILVAVEASAAATVAAAAQRGAATVVFVP